MRTSTQILQESYDYFKQHIEVYFGIYCISIAVGIVSTYVLKIPTELTGITDPSIIAAFFLTTLLGALVQMLAYSASIYVSAYGEGVTLASAFARALRRLPQMLLIGILSALAIFVGIILFIIPGIIVSLWFSCAAMILLLEDKGVIESMRASKQLVTGRLGQMFSYVLLCVGVMILAVIAAVIVGIILGFVAQVNDLIMDFIIYLLFFPVTAVWYIYFYRVYREFKQVTENEATQFAPQAAATESVSN